jgi:hypothetical protein
MKTTKNSRANGCTRGDGYVAIYAGRDDPLSNGAGQVLEHRKVLFDSIGDDTHIHKCYGCRRRVWWFPKARNRLKLEVDHLNAVKDDNRRENLAASCAHCNRSRRGPCRGKLLKRAIHDFFTLTNSSINPDARRVHQDPID